MHCAFAKRVHHIAFEKLKRACNIWMMGDAWAKRAAMEGAPHPTLDCIQYTLEYVTAGMCPAKSHEEIGAFLCTAYHIVVKRST